MTWFCTFSGCNERFDTKEEMEDHRRKKHNSKLTDYDSPSDTEVVE